MNGVHTNTRQIENRLQRVSYPVSQENSGTSSNRNVTNVYQEGVMNHKGMVNPNGVNITCAKEIILATENGSNIVKHLDISKIQNKCSDLEKAINQCDTYGFLPINNSNRVNCFLRIYDLTVYFHMTNLIPLKYIMKLPRLACTIFNRKKFSSPRPLILSCLDNCQKLIGTGSCLIL